MSPGERAREESQIRYELDNPLPSNRGKCIHIGTVRFHPKTGKLIVEDKPKRRRATKGAGR